MALNAPKIVLIGGGTGSFTLLQELKRVTPNITAIVNMSDDGGSTGILRDELGVLPPGDLRQCLVALSDTSEARDIFSYRFNTGSLKNQSLGNIILSGLELKYGSVEKAIETTATFLHITGQVVPVTTDKHTLVMRDGPKTISGQNKIEHYSIKNPDAFLELYPFARINPSATEAINNADLIVIAPGNLYASLLPTLAVEGMPAILSQAPAIKIVVTNLVTKPGQTDGWHVVDYVKALERCIGKDQIDVVLYNNELPSTDLLKKYAAENELPVNTTPDRFEEIAAKAIGAPLLAKKVFAQDKNDTAIKRTLIRHDARKVCLELMSLLY